jgi:short-subunit dehydrogenase
MPKVDLAGRVIVITGASAGIGRAIAKACADNDMRLAINARGAGRLAELAEDLRARGTQVIQVAGDTTDAAVRAELLARAADLGPVYAVLANAGYGHEVETLAMPEADLRQMFEVNFFAGLALLREAAPGMLDRGEGHLMMTSSCLSKIGLPMYAAYCATKAAQDYACRAMRHELANKGLAVSSIHPVGTKTEFFDRMGERSGGLKLMDRSAQSFMQPPEKVARAVVRALRAGKGREVWTSLGGRVAFGAAVMLPGLTDLVLRQMVTRRVKSSATGR